jgi:starch phosphorylase
VIADAADCTCAQNSVDQAWLDPIAWSASSVMNTMNCGFFSSDRSIKEYAQRIWKLNALPIGSDGGP